MNDVYAKIDMTNPGSGTGTVVNMQVMASTDPKDTNFTWVDITSIAPSPGIGWTYNGSTFTNPAPPYTPPIPDVSPRQIRLALIASGVSLASIDAAIATLPSPNNSIAQATWDYSLAFERTNPMVAELGAMLGWSSAQLDALWNLAAGL